MNVSKIRSLAQQILDETAGSFGAAPPAAPAVAPTPRAPLGIDNQDVREWSDAVGATTLRMYQHAIEQRTPGIVGPWDALALWANRPETPEAEAETIRRSRRRLAERFGIDEPYSAAIARSLAENATLPGDPNAPGFLAGE